MPTEVAERTNSGRLFQREGAQELKALVPVLVLILGTDRVIPLFDLSERDEEKWQSRSEGKQVVPHEELCVSKQILKWTLYLTGSR